MKHAMSSPWIDPPQRLRTIPPRMPYAGATVIVIMLISLAVGLFLTGVSLGWIAVTKLGSGPRWALALFGLIALLGGLLLLARLIQTARRRTRCAREASAWRRDYPWPRDGILADGQGCRLSLDRLPLVPGESSVATLELAATPAKLALRGVHETAHWNRVGTNAPKIRTTMFYRQELEACAIVDGKIRFELAIPREAPPTRLAEPPLTYWELVVRNERDKEIIILLPVYPAEVNRKPGAPHD